jgi:hypothetical protein
MEIRRQRVTWIVACGLVLLLGIASRRIPGIFPEVFGKYPGDVLWALAVYCGWAIVMPGASVSRVMLCTLASSYLVECSQLYHAPWIDAIRRTTLGHLVLGFTFHSWDFLAYTIGAALGVLLDLRWTNWDWRTKGAGSNQGSRGRGS